MHKPEVSPRFWSKVDVRGDNECWEWQATKNTRGGYGCFKNKREDGKFHQGRAHRIALELHLGRFISSQTLVCHKCDNPPCCNPSHLYEGTFANNMQDSYDRNRRKITVPSSIGSGNGNAALLNDDIKTITDMIIDGFNNKEIAEQFDVSHSMISLIRLKKSWTHLKCVQDLPNGKYTSLHRKRSSTGQSVTFRK